MPTKPSGDAEKLLALIVAVPLAALIVVPGIAWQSYVLLRVWNWFMPAIFDFRLLTFGAAIAIRMVLVAARSYSSVSESKLSKNLVAVYVQPAFLLGVAWIIRWLVNTGQLAL